MNNSGVVFGNEGCAIIYIIGEKACTVKKEALN